MRQLTVLGSVNADHVVKVNNFPRPGETLHGQGYAVIAGGKGANQAVAAARLGANVNFIACVGDDAFGMGIRNTFEQDGINVEGVMVEEDTPTGIAMIQVSATGENSICICAEANAHLTPQRISPHQHIIERADILLLQLEVPIETIEKAAEIANLSGTTVVLNPAPAQRLTDPLLALVDIITPNETEAEVLTGIKVTDEQSAQLAANVLHNKGIKTVLITLGSKGVWLSKGEAGQRIEGYRVQAIDTTAAGDTFNGALLTGLLEDKNLDEAIHFAHAAAALTVMSEGAQSSIPYRDDVNDFLRTRI
ncbi:MAG: ribokinase [Psychromonas sp.]